MKRVNRSGQSILEYTLLLGAVIAVIVVVLLGQDTGIKSKVESAYGKAGEAIENTANDLTTGIFQE